MKKPDNQRTDLEALRRQLRQEFREIATNIVEEKIDEVILSGDSGSVSAATAEDPEGEDDDKDKDKKPAPFIQKRQQNIYCAN
jgi:hypothetical protein